MLSRFSPVEVEAKAEAPMFGAENWQPNPAGCAGRGNLQPLRRQVFSLSALRPI